MRLSMIGVKPYRFSKKERMLGGNCYRHYLQALNKLKPLQNPPFSNECLSAKTHMIFPTINIVLLIHPSMENHTPSLVHSLGLL